MSDFSDEYYCQRLCPLFEEAGDQMPWRCLTDCAYDEDMVLMPLPPPKSVYTRNVPMYVKRDPREFYHAHLIEESQYALDPFRDRYAPLRRRRA